MPPRSPLLLNDLAASSKVLSDVANDLEKPAASTAECAVLVHMGQFADGQDPSAGKVAMSSCVE